MAAARSANALTNTLPIIIGAVVGFLIILTIAVFITRRRKHQTQPVELASPAIPQYEAVTPFGAVGERIHHTVGQRPWNDKLYTVGQGPWNDKLYNVSDSVDAPRYETVDMFDISHHTPNMLYEESSKPSSTQPHGGNEGVFDELSHQNTSC